MVFIFSGLRSGEVTALKWVHIDFINHKLYVLQNVRMSVISSPKTGERVVDMPTVLVAELEKLKETSTSEWLFPSSRTNKNFSDTSSINDRYFKPLLERVGVRYKGLYTLRHSYATHSLAGGQDGSYVSHQLGHASVATTFKFYNLFLEDAENAKRTDEILKFD